MRWKMKKILSVFLTFILLASFGGIALAKEIIVQLTVPGCSAWNTKARIGSILKKVDGVKNHENKGNDFLIITFDDEKTTLSIIIDELKKGKFIVNGEPVYLK